MFSKMVSPESLIGKKIIELDVEDTYPLGYIIVEGGEFTAFENDDEGGIFRLSHGHIYRKLYCYKSIRDLFLRHECITQEAYDSIEEQIKKDKTKQEESQTDRDYKTYLQLKKRFETV